MIRRPPRSTLSSSSAASDVYKRQPARGKASIIADHKRALEDRRKVAAVIGVTEGSGVGNFVGHNQVAPAQFGGIDAGLVGGGIDQPLHQIARLRTAGAAIGSGR